MMGSVEGKKFSGYFSLVERSDMPLSFSPDGTEEPIDGVNEAKWRLYEEYENQRVRMGLVAAVLPFFSSSDLKRATADKKKE